jgi:ribosome-associated heat shock protein Hsp15
VAEDGLRIDVWLWRARFFKTRALAAAQAGAGRIRLRREREEGRIDKPSRLVRPGDELTFAVASRIIAVRVLALGARRGPAVEAQSLYERLDEL